MKHDAKGMDKKTKKPIDDAAAEIVITSPSKKTSSVGLRTMTDRFGAGLTPNKKGTYILNLRIEAAKETHCADFRYSVEYLWSCFDCRAIGVFNETLAQRR